jgi:glycosyltransferase involved in cell wall biosynthesis
MRTCKDKGTKYMIGLVHAKNYKPDYVMFFDADDFIHRNIAEYVNTNLVQNGWFIDKGYLYRNGGMLISKLRNFHSCCGTCNILNFKFIEPPKDFTISTTQDTIVERIDHQYLYMILGDHSHTESYYRKIGYPLKAFPFPAAIWVVETSENISGRRFSNFGFPHIINEKLNEEFNIGLSLSFRFRLRGMILEWPKEIIKQRHKIVKKLIALTRNVKA